MPMSKASIASNYHVNERHESRIMVILPERGWKLKARFNRASASPSKLTNHTKLDGLNLQRVKNVDPIALCIPKKTNFPYDNCCVYIQ